MPNQAPRIRRRAVLIDALLILALCGSSYWVGSTYFRTFHATGAKASFARAELGAAVGLACGRGFLNPGADLPEAFNDFFAERRDDLSCAEFPSGREGTQLTFTQGLYQYLHMTIGLFWWWSGVSWTSLEPFAGLLFAASAGLVYGLFRLGMSRGPAVVATALLSVSAVQLGNLPYLRDYAKMPFMLALLLLLGLIVKREVTARSLVVIGVVFGLVLGVGFGFRNDVLITLPPFAAAVWLFAPGGVRAHWRLKMIATAAMVVTFLIAASPILLAYSAGSNTGHVAVLGLMSTFDAPLGVTPSVYEWGHTYLDMYAGTVVMSYAERTGHGAIEYLSPAYDRAAVQFLADVARQYPGDILTRGLASLLRVLDVPFAYGVYTNPSPYGIMDERIIDLYRQAGARLSTLQGTGVSIAVALSTLAVISVRSLRLAAFVLLLLVYFGAYPVIQFSGRHLFHLEFVTFWMTGCLVSSLIAFASGILPALWRADERARLASPAAVSQGLRAAATLVAVPVIVLSLCVGSVLAARAYQRPRVAAMLDQVIAAAREPVQMSELPREGGLVLKMSPAFNQGDLRELQAQYLVAEFGAGTCDATTIPITLRYHQFPSASYDYSKVLVVPLGAEGALTRVVFPVYDTPFTRFDGIEIPAPMANCLDRVSRVTTIERFPVLVTAVLPPDWKTRRMYQAVTDWEGAEPVQAGAVEGSGRPKVRLE